MNAKPSQPHPAEWTETQGLLPSAPRDLPAGRHQFHKEQMMTQIHEDLRTSAAATASDDRPVAVPRHRNPFLRRVVLVPAAALALSGAVVTTVVVSGGDGDGGRTPLATGPALTTTVGTADTQGAPRLLDRISSPPPRSPNRRRTPASTSTSPPRSPTPTPRRSMTRPRSSARSCTPARSGTPWTARTAG